MFFRYDLEAVRQRVMCQPRLLTTPKYSAASALTTALESSLVISLRVPLMILYFGTGGLEADMGRVEGSCGLWS